MVRTTVAARIMSGIEGNDESQHTCDQPRHHFPRQSKPSFKPRQSSSGPASNSAVATRAIINGIVVIIACMIISHDHHHRPHHHLRCHDDDDDDDHHHHHHQQQSQQLAIYCALPCRVACTTPLDGARVTAIHLTITIFIILTIMIMKIL